MKKAIYLSIGRLFILLLATFFLINETAFAAAVTLLRKPTIHNVTPTSMVIVWTTEENGSSEVQYGVGDFSQTAVATTTLLTTDANSPYDQYYVHEATLTGMSSNTMYQYRIMTSGVNLTPGGSVDVRSGRSTSDRTFRFAAFGDSGTGSSGQQGVARRLEQIAPDLVVHGGDMVYDTNYQTIETKHFQIYEDLLDHVWLPPTVGNHDMYNNGAVIADSFVNPPNPSSDPIERELYYSFDYGNVHFTVLATELQTRTSSDQYKWLEDDLADSDQFWKVVVMHEPPYTGDGIKFDKLVDLFEANDVDIVISGDRHFYERMKPLKNDNVTTIENGGILYMVSGGGGTGLGSIGDEPWPERTAERAALYHLIMFDVDDCRVEMSAVEQSTGDGFDATDIFDSFIVDKCGDGPTASFTADFKSGAAPLTVNFSDLSSGGPTSWNWDFGDGNGSTEQNPIHEYTATGIYTVELTVSDGAKSSSERRVDYIEVTEAAAEFTLASELVTVDETAGTATVNVLLTNPATQSVSVAYEVVAGTAVSDFDYTATAGTLTFGVGESFLPLTIPIIDDVLDEADETAVIRLLNPTLGVIGTPGEATLTITDDDEPPTVQFSQTDFSVSESGVTAIMTATLSVASGQAVTVDVASSNETAVVDNDYEQVAETITFAPGESSQTISLTVLEDLVEESAETVLLTLSNPVNATLGTPNPATLTILDNDSPPLVSFAAATVSESEDGGVALVPVVLQGETIKTITVEVTTSDGTAVAGEDYTATTETLSFAPGTMTAMVTIPLLNDALDEPSETVTLTLSNLVNGEPGTHMTSTLEIVDEDEPPAIAFGDNSYSEVESAGSTVITVELAEPSAKMITVDYDAMDAAGKLGKVADFTPISGTLTFTPGVTSQSFVVTLVDDLIDEPDETAVLTLSNPDNGVLGDPAGATLTITDDDDPPTIAFSGATAEVNEADGTVVISATLSVESAKEISVMVETIGETADAGDDFTSASEVLTFAPGVVLQTVTIPLINDDQVEPNETLSVVLSSPDNATLGDPAELRLTVVDDDQPTVIFAETELAISEDGVMLFAQVVLSEASPLPVTIEYATVSGTAVSAADFTPISGTLTIEPGNTSASLNITIIDDQSDEPDEAFSVQLLAADGGILAGDETLTVNVIDNDDPPTIAFVSEGFQADEDAGFGHVMIMLSQPSGKTVQVNFATIAASATAGEDYTAVLTTLTFAPGEASQTVEIPLLPDELQEGNESISLLLGNAVNADWGVTTTAVLTIIDGDGTILYLPIIQRPNP